MIIILKCIILSKKMLLYFYFYFTFTINYLQNTLFKTVPKKSSFMVP